MTAPREKRREPGQPQKCSDLDCEELAVAIVADGRALCAEAALEWYERARSR